MGMEVLMVNYKFSFSMSFLVALVGLVVFLLAGVDDPGVGPAVFILGGGTSLYFLIQGLIEYLGLKK